MESHLFLLNDFARSPLSSDDAVFEFSDEFDTILYKTKKGMELSSLEIMQCSDLYSNHYGCWSADSPTRPGERIKLSAEFFRKDTFKPGIYASLAIHNDTIIGLAIYLRKNYENFGYISWVLRLVVHSSYRQKGIATKLLYSIWGFSGDTAWGLATANPLTVKTLEKATFRKCDPLVIYKNIDVVQKIMADVRFARDAELIVGNNHSLIDTCFYVDTSNLFDLLEKFGESWQLGELACGTEWLAFTFQEQKMNISSLQFDEIRKHSRAALNEAYSRMDIINHPWARHASSEVEYLTEFIAKGSNPSILDMGCGTGRHLISFAMKGYKGLGIDFSNRHISMAKCLSGEKMLSNLIEFRVADCRDFVSRDKYDIVLMLYDVVGSFTEQEENEKMISNAYKNLKKGGMLFLSVMNLELTQLMAIHKINRVECPSKVLELIPSGTMQKTGDIFNPDFFLLEEDTGVIYRKEQFSGDDLLSAEYIVCDKRFTMDEISGLISKYKFKIIESRYVQAGRFETPLTATSNNAKEILVVATKE